MPTPYKCTEFVRGLSICESHGYRHGCCRDQSISAIGRNEELEGVTHLLTVLIEPRKDLRIGVLKDWLVGRVRYTTIFARKPNPSPSRRLRSCPPAGESLSLPPAAIRTGIFLSPPTASLPSRSPRFCVLMPYIGASAANLSRYRRPMVHVPPRPIECPFR